MQECDIPAKYGTLKIPVITFDQPLWLKTTEVVNAKALKSGSNSWWFSSHDAFHWQYWSLDERFWDF